jgi:hypothetical protein
VESGGGKGSYWAIDANEVKADQVLTKKQNKK